MARICVLALHRDQSSVTGCATNRQASSTRRVSLLVGSVNLGDVGAAEISIFWPKKHFSILGSKIDFFFDFGVKNRFPAQKKSIFSIFFENTIFLFLGKKKSIFGRKGPKMGKNGQKWSKTLKRVDNDEKTVQKSSRP